MSNLPVATAIAVLVFVVGCNEPPHDHHDGDHDHAPAVKTAEAKPGTGPSSAPAAAAVAATGNYICPMDADVRSDHAGRCPKCGMDLVLAPAGAPKTFNVMVTSLPEAEAGKAGRLTFTVVDDTMKRVTDFDVVHEKKLHLLMASKDLSWFAHEHPDVAADGSFALDFTFPAAGEYRLYSDFRPTGAKGQVIQKLLVVKGTAGAAAAPAVALVKDDLTKAKTVAGHQVRLKTSSLNAGDAVKLDFLVVKGGKPVATFTPYLGAMGHCVILSADGQDFLHSHPEDVAHDGHDDTGTAPHAHPAAPGTVSFQTTFPRAGLYKIWGQFQDGTDMIIAPFVVDVAAATGKAPAAADGHDHGDHKH